MRLAPFTSRYAARGMVCAVDHLAAGAGASLLRLGGSAIDAAVATSAVLAVTTQHMCGMGGDLFALVHDGAPNPYVLNASGRAGSGADPERLRREGHQVMPMRDDIRAVPVPGCVDGWLALHARFGTLPLAEVLAPAIKYAEDGFPASPTLVAAAPTVATRRGGEAFAAAVAPGALVRRPGVGRALRAILSEGRDGFYRGEFGAGLLSLGNGEFSDGDLDQTNADWVEPLSLEVFGACVHTAPPNSQGYLTLAAASLVAKLELPPDPDDPLWAHYLIEASRLAAFDRNAVLHEHADGNALISPERLGARASAIKPDRTAELGDSYAEGGTIFLCAVDENRMGVSLIQSNAGGFGVGIAEQSTGIFLQNRGVGFSLVPGHPAEYGPGRRPPHTLSPVLVTNEDGSLRLVIGTMGGDSQPQILLQLLWRVLVGHEQIGDAVSAPRFVLSNTKERSGFATWAEGGTLEVQLEEGAPLDWEDGLRARGHLVAPVRPVGHGFGHAHAISLSGDHLEGASDPRSLAGAVAGY